MAYQEPDRAGPGADAQDTALRTDAPASGKPVHRVAAEPGNAAATHHLDDVAQVFARATQHAKLFKADALRNASEALRSTDGAVHLHPYRAIGIAALVALALGYLVARR